ncbi:MAG: deoxyguanosinetriphosphate triphosphohydrolase [Planctomycetota bacterium]|nr:deoxyguanosinetriphosphate triphosphohydrolase [Planctomycetota bacterium]
MLTRSEFEMREQRELAPYAVKSRESRGREHPEEEHVFRSAFQRDRDRIIHATAFRRLEYKTQVFVNHEGDYYRTRLTHTMEAAQIARTISRALRLNEDLTEATALSHDLGHTPFGHSGEDAMEDLMADHGGFEHNRQSLRVVDILEKRYPGFRGLNLTYEVRESIAKHSSRPDPAWEAEFRLADKPLLEAQVVDIADSIAYDNHDIDDGLQAGLISSDDLAKTELWRRALGAVEAACVGQDRRVRDRQAIIYLINLEVGDLLETTDRTIQESKIDSQETVRSAPGWIVRFSDEMAEQRKELQAFLMRWVYRHYRVVRMASKARRFIVDLFNEYVRHPEALPQEFQGWVAEVGLHRGICDYIAGMTDRYAQDEHRKLFDPFERT